MQYALEHGYIASGKKMCIRDRCKDAHIITVPQGEASKSFKILESVLRQMLDVYKRQGLRRSTLPLLSLRDIFPRRGGSLSAKGEALAKR